MKKTIISGPSTAPVHRPGAQSATARILVVAGEASNLLEGLLTRSGHSVLTTASTLKAFQILERGGVDLVVSVVQPPDRNPEIEFLRWARFKFPDTPCILITTQLDQQAASLAVELGASDCLPGPPDSADLNLAVERAIRERVESVVAREGLTLVRELESRRAAETELGERYERALESLRIAYQPIVRAADGSVFGYEALMRVDAQALSGPLSMLEAAERLRRLQELGRKIRWLAAPPVARGAFGVNLFINMLAEDLLDDTLLAADSPLAKIADRTILEITERRPLVGAGVRSRIAELREVGYRFALDDFGVGYSGLSTLETLQPEVIKVDIALVRGIDCRPRKQKLIRSVVEFAKGENCLVVAEGVETVPERDKLIDLGCDLLQGHLMAKPGPAFPPVQWPKR